MFITSGGQKSRMVATELKSRCWQSSFFPGGSRGQLVFLASPASRGCLCPLALPSSIFKVSNGQLGLSYTAPFLVLKLLLTSSPFKDACDHIGPFQIIQDILLILRSTDKQP